MKKFFSARMTVTIMILVLLILIVAAIKLYAYESTSANSNQQNGEITMMDPDEGEDYAPTTNPNDDGFGTEVAM